MGQPVVHFEILTKDPDALGEFFHKAFDWKINPLSEGGANVAKYNIAQPTGQDVPERSINGGIGGLPPNGYKGHVTFYIAVDDVETALQRVESFGGKRMMGPEQVPDGPVIGLFEDPQGNVIGVVEPDM